VEKGIYPAVDPLTSTSRSSIRAWWERSIMLLRARSSAYSSATKDLYDIIAILGTEELSERIADLGARAQDREVSFAAYVRGRTIPAAPQIRD